VVVVVSELKEMWCGVSFLNMLRPARAGKGATYSTAPMGQSSPHEPSPVPHWNDYLYRMSDFWEFESIKEKQLGSTNMQDYENKLPKGLIPIDLERYGRLLIIAYRTSTRTPSNTVPVTRIIRQQ
jgi:hypothetical protein